MSARLLAIGTVPVAGQSLADFQPLEPSLWPALAGPWLKKIRSSVLKLTPSHWNRTPVCQTSSHKNRPRGSDFQPQEPSPWSPLVALSIVERVSAPSPAACKLRQKQDVDKVAERAAATGTSSEEEWPLYGKGCSAIRVLLISPNIFCHIRVVSHHIFINVVRYGLYHLLGRHVDTVGLGLIAYHHDIWHQPVIYIGICGARRLFVHIRQ